MTARDPSSFAGRFEASPLAARVSREQIDARDRDLGFGTVVGRDSRQRLLNRDGSFNVVRRGLSALDGWAPYHQLLTMSWARFVALVVVAYVGLRIVVNSRFGNVLVAIRENPERAEMLGYNVRAYQLAVFVIGSVLAGMSGALYTLWGSYITPSSMGLTAAALPIIWVAAGGRKDLTATLIATVFLTWLSQQLAVKGNQYALIWMGAILLTVVLFAPEGLFVSLWKAVQSRVRRGRRSSTAKTVPLLPG